MEALDVSEYLDLYTEKHPRFEEAWNALKWLLARNPEPKGSVTKVGTARPYRAYVLAGDVFAGTPDLWVTYTYTADEVLILAVQAVDPPEEQDEEET